jgi:hypothetical protein
MPGFNRTGPRGSGAVTGGGRGYCALRVVGSLASGAGRRMGLGRGFLGRGRGFGDGFGRGRGKGLGFGPSCVGTPNISGMAPETPCQTALSSDQEIALLHEQTEGVRNQLQSIERRLDALTQASNAA